ncbi:hypothetical protein LTR95_016633 [Oleoguttula sp. CCFEE 5521]
MTLRTLDEVFGFAPEEALQDLAAYVGLYYDEIITNQRKYERLQQHRATYAKRGLQQDSSFAKRDKRDEHSVGEEQRITRAETPQPKAASLALSSEEVGWDAPFTEDQIPSGRYLPTADPSLASVSSSPNIQLPTRKIPSVQGSD